LFDLWLVDGIHRIEFTNPTFHGSAECIPEKSDSSQLGVIGVTIADHSSLPRFQVLSAQLFQSAATYVRDKRAVDRDLVFLVRQC
jgi:hypothetical protein